MGRGGKYLSKTKKKGKGLKILLIVVAVMVVLGGTAAFMGMRYLNSVLDMIPRAEVIEQSVSFEDIQDILNYNPDTQTGEDLENESVHSTAEYGAQSTLEPSSDNQ